MKIYEYMKTVLLRRNTGTGALIFDRLVFVAGDLVHLVFPVVNCFDLIDVGLI